MIVRVMLSSFGCLGLGRGSESEDSRYVNSLEQTWIKENGSKFCM